MSFRQAVPTDIMPAIPIPFNARVPSKALYVFELADPIFPRMAKTWETIVTGRRP